MYLPIRWIYKIRRSVILTLKSMRYEMTKTWQNMKTISVLLNSTGQSTGFETLKLIDPDVPQDLKFQLEGRFYPTFWIVQIARTICGWWMTNHCFCFSMESTLQKANIDMENLPFVSICISLPGEALIFVDLANVIQKWTH